MRTLLALAVLLGLALPVQAQQADAQAILDKALKAHGDEKTALKLTASTAKGKGTISAMGMDLEFSIETWSQLPDKTKSIINLNIEGMMLEIVQVINGGKGWSSLLGMVQDLEADQIKEAQEAMYAGRIAGLYGIKADKTLKLSPLGETKVGDKTVVGIQVTKKDKRDVNLYFDKTTNMLLKSETRATNPFTMMEVNAETLYDNYKEVVPGVKSATKVTVNHDGKRYLEFQVSEATAVEKLDESIFAKPG
ncbi:MAG TPA: hypothetical protein VE988_29660 [Gemmataceae bacterium]|nr:hypothetical protein [Gemmataceae bacterium]